MDNHQKQRELVAAEYGIALYRRYREKEAAALVGYEAAWWKRHRKAGTILYVRDPGGGIAYFGYMLCDLLLLGEKAVTQNLPRVVATDVAQSPPRPEVSGPALLEPVKATVSSPAEVARAILSSKGE